MSAGSVISSVSNAVFSATTVTPPAPSVDVTVPVIVVGWTRQLKKYSPSGNGSTE